MTDMKRILIAEDDGTTRTVLTRMLENAGYQVVSSERGEKCLFLALERDFDAFLIDINMPGINGIDLCRRLRNMPRFKVVPIIIVTSLNDASSLNEVFLAGATDFIVKPVNPIVLSARLRAHIERVEYFNEVESIRNYLSRYISTRTQRMAEAYALTGLLPMPEQHDVCVMFTDIRGYTNLSHNMDLEVLFTQVSEHLGKQVELVHKSGGYIDKFGGDGLMAIFEHDAAAIRACHCALAIMKMCRQQTSDTKNISLPIGIGLHYGPVLIGNIGSEEHLDYSALGETVNLSSRLCSHAESMTIDVSEALMLEVKTDDRLQFTVPEAVNVKGFDEPIRFCKLKENSNEKNAAELIS
jgi:adenylate cyclase